MTQRRQYFIGSATVDEINFQFSQLADRLDQMEGFRGNPNFQANIDMGSNKVANLAPGVDSTDAVAVSQASILVGGFIPTNNLGTGTASVSSVLRGNQTWGTMKVGSFQMDAAASKVVSDTAVSASSTIICFPTNAAAGVLMGGAKHLYILTRIVGTSFEVKTANAAAAGGTETFNYILIN